MLNKDLKILVVEDDEIDRESIRRAFKKHEVLYPAFFAKDGVEGLEMLRGQSDTTIEHPYIIFLDLNMPRMNGLEFLDELRHDEKLKNAIVFILTTSSADKDKCAAYDKNIAGYVLKSKVGENFVNIINILKDYEHSIEFPPKHRYS